VGKLDVIAKKAFTVAANGLVPPSHTPWRICNAKAASLASNGAAKEVPE
jgi:hypothetical protein